MYQNAQQRICFFLMKMSKLSMGNTFYLRNKILHYLILENISRHFLGFNYNKLSVVSD